LKEIHVYKSITDNVIEHSRPLLINFLTLI
jgi:hypothetical protein